MPDPSGSDPDARARDHTGAESYGGDTDAAPSVTEEELERGLDRDQAEG